MVTATIPLLEEWKSEKREVPAIRDLRGSYYVRQERTGVSDVYVMYYIQDTKIQG